MQQSTTVISTDSEVGRCYGNPPPGTANAELPGASHGLQWLSWIVIGETGPGPAETGRTGIPGGVKGLCKGMTEVGALGDPAAWWCLGSGVSAGWD